MSRTGPLVGLEGWRNGFLEGARDATVPTPMGPVRVTSSSDDYGSATTWTIAMSTRDVDVALTQAGHSLRGWKRLWPRPRWVQHAGLRIVGQPEAFARRLAEHPAVGGALQEWRAFELEVRSGHARLCVATTNVDALQAALGVEMVLAVAVELARMRG